MTDDSSTTPRDDDSGEETWTVDRSFTCTACGYPMTHTVDELQREVRSTCLNCGDWTVQAANVEDVIDGARGAAERLAGSILTERQALAYLLRDVVGVDRQLAAEAMDTTASNVDNLQRRGREKVETAEALVAELERLRTEGDPNPANTAES